MESALNQALSNDDIPGARRALGTALHTLQDFYSHSNWVELVNTSPANPNQTLSALIPPYPDIFPPLPYPIASDLEATCSPDQGTLDATKLTSGYFQDIFNIQYNLSNPTSPNLPPFQKCIHGGVTDQLTLTFGLVGINKDSPNPLVSPHYQYHSQAVQLATNATMDFIRAIRANLQGPNIDDEFADLLGVSTL